jgi:hypothetical protein
VLVDLLEEEGALEAELGDATVLADDARVVGVVGVGDVVYTASQVDAFAVVGGFDRGREVFLRVCEGAGCCVEVSTGKLGRGRARGEMRRADEDEELRTLGGRHLRLCYVVDYLD